MCFALIYIFVMFFVFIFVFSSFISDIFLLLFAAAWTVLPKHNVVFNWDRQRLFLSSVLSTNSLHNAAAVVRLAKCP